MYQPIRTLFCPDISCFPLLSFGAIALVVYIAASGGSGRLNLSKKMSAFSLRQFRAKRTHLFLLSQRFTGKEGA